METPQELYRHSSTLFVASFIGKSIPVKNFDRFRFFEKIAEDITTILRPEFISVFKKGKNVQLSKSAGEVVVEDIVFRVSNIEIKCKIS